MEKERIRFEDWKCRFAERKQSSIGISQFTSLRQRNSIRKDHIATGINDRVFLDSLYTSAINNISQRVGDLDQLA